MNIIVVPVVAPLVFLLAFLTHLSAPAQSNLTFRVMAANITSGNNQSYEAPGIRIFQGLKPDIVAVQEFRYNASASDGNLRQLVDTAFGTNFYFYREPYTGGGDIPNGIVSRWPILDAGSWNDTQVANRGFAWALIDLPGTNDLYIVSVHLLTSGSTVRNTEANNLKTLIQSNFPTNAWVIIAGDMNTDSRSEAAINTFKTFLSDSPVPTDSESGGDDGTNANRNKPYDYVLPSFSLTNYLVPVALPSRTFPKGLVFDSRVYTPLGDVAPVLSGDSGVSGMQHMAVIKDFTIPVGETVLAAPVVTVQPQNQTNALGSTASFAVTATGTAPLSFQWRFNSTNLIGATATSVSVTNLQPTDAGDYSVVITNTVGSVTSDVARLVVVTSPTITQQPQNLSAPAGTHATFNVEATGLAPLQYQWRFENVEILNATNSVFTRSNAQFAHAGSYSVVITNSSGSVTSAPAHLAVTDTGVTGIIAQWNFNSVPPDGMANTGTTSPAVGSGTAALSGGATATFATGDTTLDSAGSTDNSGWNTTTYPAQGTGNKSRGIQFNVSTTGKQNVSVTWSSQASNTGSRYGRLQYSTNGTDFVDFPSAFTNTTSYTRKTNSLATIPALNDNANFAIRFVAEFESSAIDNGNGNYVGANGTYGPGGTIRYDMITVWGSDVVIPPTPAVPPVLSNAHWNGTDFRFDLLGTTASNYVIQAATNLDEAIWMSLRTNAAPFLYVETNAIDWQQRFYRGQVAP